MSITKNPMIWAFCITLVTLAVGASTVVLADFGSSTWIFLALTAWLCTIGLPTTLAVVLLASFWGKLPGLTGLLSFTGCAFLVSLVFQMASFLLLAKLSRRSSRKEA